MSKCTSRLHRSPTTFEIFSPLWVATGLGGGGALLYVTPPGQTWGLIAGGAAILFGLFSLIVLDKALRECY